MALSTPIHWSPAASVRCAGVTRDGARCRRMVRDGVLCQDHFYTTHRPAAGVQVTCPQCGASKTLAPGSDFILGGAPAIMLAPRSNAAFSVMVPLCDHYAYALGPTHGTITGDRGSVRLDVQMTSWLDSAHGPPDPPAEPPPVALSERDEHPVAAAMARAATMREEDP